METPGAFYCMHKQPRLAPPRGLLAGPAHAVISGVGLREEAGCGGAVVSLVRDSLPLRRAGPGRAQAATVRPHSGLLVDLWAFISSVHSGSDNVYERRRRLWPPGLGRRAAFPH